MFSFIDLLTYLNNKASSDILLKISKILVIFCLFFGFFYIFFQLSCIITGKTNTKCNSKLQLPVLKNENKITLPKISELNNSIELVKVVPLTPKTQNKEVFNVIDSHYKYSDAENICKKYDATLATKQQMIDAVKSGASWCNLGWINKAEAYYPISIEQHESIKNAEMPLRNICGTVGLNGGKYPLTTNLSVNCYGVKPADDKSLNMWNNINKKYSKWDN